MRISKEYFWTALKHLVLFALLLCATMLLLELPALYYKKADGELLLERGTSSYQLKSVNQNYILFAEKLKIFQDIYGNYALGEFSQFTEEEVLRAEATLAGEIIALLGEDYKKVSDALERGEMESKGMCIPVMDYSQKQVKMWDMGVLVFSCKEKNWEGIAVYDEESGKLFWLACEVPGIFKQEMVWSSTEKGSAINDEGYMEEEISHKTQTEESYMERIKAYYDGVGVVWEECDVYWGESVYITPLTIKEVERSSVLWDMQYFFNNIYNSIH